MFVGIGSPRIGSDGLEEAISHMQVTLFPSPKKIMREFVAEDGFDFFRVQQIQDLAGKNDMSFAGNEEERGIHLRAVLRLINGDGNIQLQPGLGGIDALVKFGMARNIQAVGGLEEFAAEILGVIGERAGGSEPIPQFMFMRFEIIAQLNVIRQRFERCVWRWHGTRLLV